jgi:hypothetical protein
MRMVSLGFFYRRGAPHDKPAGRESRALADLRAGRFDGAAVLMP